MVEKTGVLKTTVVCSDDQSKVYEICREFDSDGDEVILVTLYPTLAEPNLCDLSGLHLLNHASDEKLNFKTIHFVFLFSQVVKGKLSAKTLEVDRENLNYIREIIKKTTDSKIIISFGSSLEKNAVVTESKVELFKIIKEMRSDDALWKISAEGMEEDAPHILFAGIRYGDLEWSLSHYIVPHKYTPEGYKEYLAGKEAQRERFLQNVLGKKKEERTEEKKAVKGKRKDDNSKKS